MLIYRQEDHLSLYHTERKSDIIIKMVAQKYPAEGEIQRYVLLIVISSIA